MRLTIITINRNNLDGLKLTARSILAQQCQEFQWVVIDGASLDGSVEFMKSLHREKMVFLSEPDTGIYNAMNKGVQYATGEYCLFINSGDALYSPQSASLCLQTLEQQPQVDIFRFAIELQLNQRILVVAHPAQEKEIRTGLFLLTHGIAHQGAVIRRSLLLDYPYDESFKICADYDFFLHCYLHKPIQDAPVDQILSLFDCSGISSTNPELLRKEMERAFVQQTSRVIYQDYWRFFKGGTLLEKVVVRLKRSPFFSFLALLSLLPVYLLHCAKALIVNFPAYLRRLREYNSRKRRSTNTPPLKKRRNLEI